MKTKLFAVVLLAGGSLFAETHWSIGIGLGTPYYYDYTPPPPPPVVYTPSSPYPARGGYAWHAGFWSRPPYAGAYWVSPQYYENRSYLGYWDRRERHWDLDDDDRWEHHDRGLHRGWYRRHDD